MRSNQTVIVASFVFAACSAEAHDAGVVVRDSASVTLIEHSDGSAPATWTVSSGPTVTIGAREGAEEHMLFRVAAAFRLADGRIVVANGGSTEYRFYDAAGEHLMNAGGEGSGPGEMRVLFEVTRLAGDTLVAFDPALGRMDWFDGSGAFVHRTSVDLRSMLQPPYFSEGAHVLPDRSILMRVYEGSGPNLPEGVYRSNLGFFRYDTATEVVDTLTWVGALENFIIRVGERTVPGVRPFARRALEVWGPEAVYIADTDRYEIQKFPLDGSSPVIIRRARAGPSVTPADRASFEERYRGFASRNPDREGDMGRWLASVTFPETKPPISGLHADRLGHLWVSETPAQETELVVWSVFDPSGRLVAEVELSDGFAPMDIGVDYVLGRVRDADDVEFVEMYGLSR